MIRKSALGLISCAVLIVCINWLHLLTTVRQREVQCSGSDIGTTAHGERKKERRGRGLQGNSVEGRRIGRERRRGIKEGM